MTVESIRIFLAGGQWVSIAPELRPSSLKNTDGSIKPFYLTRKFSCTADGRFELTVVNYADPYGKISLAQMFISGHMDWKGPHPIAQDAQKVDFIADEAYDVTPLIAGFADVLNQFTKGFQPWTINQTQSILKKAFPPFGLVEGQVFSEYDLVYVYDNLMFWGARNIDGRGFDQEANRPTNLQIPMVRSQS